MSLGTLIVMTSPIVISVSCTGETQNQSINFVDLKSGPGGVVPDNAIVLDVNLNTITREESIRMMNLKDEWSNIEGAQFIIKITSAELIEVDENGNPILDENGDEIPYSLYTPYIVRRTSTGTLDFATDETDGIIYEGIPYYHDFGYYDLLAEWRRFNQ